MSETCETGPDHVVIYLQPRCCADVNEGRMWCEAPQEPCEECGAEWLKFVRDYSDAPATRGEGE